MRLLSREIEFSKSEIVHGFLGPRRLDVDF